MRFYYIQSLLGLFFLLPSCGWFDEPPESKKNGPVLINVLDKELYDDCHIKGSIHVPFDKIELYARALDKKTEIIFYCSNYQCSSSLYAAEKLKQDGFENVYVYEGGMAEWYQKGYPVEGVHAQAYLSKTVQPAMQDIENNMIISLKELADKMKVS